MRRGMLVGCLRRLLIGLFEGGFEGGEIGGGGLLCLYEKKERLELALSSIIPGF